MQICLRLLCVCPRSMQCVDTTNPKFVMIETRFRSVMKVRVKFFAVETLYSFLLTPFTATMPPSLILCLRHPPFFELTTHRCSQLSRRSQDLELIALHAAVSLTTIDVRHKRGYPQDTCGPCICLFRCAMLRIAIWLCCCSAGECVLPHVDARYSVEVVLSGAFLSFKLLNY